jgi:hypothetical protein
MVFDGKDTVLETTHLGQFSSCHRVISDRIERLHQLGEVAIAICLVSTHQGMNNHRAVLNVDALGNEQAESHIEEGLNRLSGVAALGGLDDNCSRVRGKEPRRNEGNRPASETGFPPHHKSSRIYCLFSLYLPEAESLFFVVA